MMKAYALLFFFTFVAICQANSLNRQPVARSKVPDDYALYKQIYLVSRPTELPPAVGTEERFGVYGGGHIGAGAGGYLGGHVGGHLGGHVEGHLGAHVGGHLGGHVGANAAAAAAAGAGAYGYRGSLIPPGVYGR